MKNRERNIPIQVYLNEVEYDLLKKRTEQFGMTSMSELIRQFILYGITYSVDFRELHDYNWSLSNLTNNLNQLAHQANASGHADNESLKKALEIMEEVWRLQKSMLSDLQFKNQ